MKFISGYVGSGFVHLLVAAAVIATGWAASELAPERGVSVGEGSGRGPVVILEPSGSPDAGNDGAPAATRRPVRTVATVVPVDSASVIRRMDEIRRREAAEAASEAAAKPVASPRPVAPARPSVPSPTRGRPSDLPGRTPSATPGIAVATSVNPGSSGPGNSLSGGTSPATGSPTGSLASDAATRAFARDVREKFAAAFTRVFENRGSELALDADGGEVRLAISPSGVATFLDWHRAPADPKMDLIIRETLSAMSRVSPPPSGRETIVRIPVNATVSN